jgi:hypothetical protein
MAKQERKACIRLTEDELDLLLALMESMTGGPCWRRNERESWRLLEKVDRCAMRFAKELPNGDDYPSPV